MRLRIRFTKLGKVRFTSHRDVARMWERAFRRASLPVAYSEGFSPRPRLSFGLALSTGHESLGEYLDAELAVAEGLDLDELPERLSAGLPVGIDAVAVAPVVGRISLQADVRSCSWAIGVDGVEAGAAHDAVAQALAATELVTTTRRKGEPVVADVRPNIVEIEAGGSWPLDRDEPSAGGALVVRTRLATHPHGVRPADVVGAIFPPGVHERRVVRTHQWIETDGARREPLEAPDAMSSPRTPLVRA